VCYLLAGYKKPSFYFQETERILAGFYINFKRFVLFKTIRFIGWGIKYLCNKKKWLKKRCNSQLHKLQNKTINRNPYREMVGDIGLEPMTPCL